ncbi:MAG TPA: selenium metabolism-associated LysR family transcriptional regulator [Thermodesulfovibrionales bacterium]|nr:selenium metabolism-associated LysR family transcriptional regulator [Thermodesulfovibrionales bacterium]
MDIHHLRIFASVFRHKSFSKASEELFLTQPTVSDHIKTLEEELSCRLFDRLGRSIVPTKEADALYTHAVEIIEKADVLKEVIGEVRKEVAGELVIGASTIPGTYLMPSIIAAFRKAHPSTSFQIIVSDSRDIVGRILRHEFLIGIVGAKLTNHQIHYISFMEDEMIAVAAPSLMKDGVITLQDLTRIPMVMREEGSGTRREVEKILENKGVAPEEIKIAGIFGSTDAVKQAVKAGLGISIVSKFSVTDELRCKVLKEIGLKDVLMRRNFYIITHKKRTLPLVYRAFLEHIKQEAKKF